MLGILAYFLTRERVFAKIPVIVDIFFLCLFTWVTTTLWQSDTFPQSPFMFVPFTAGLAFVSLYNIFAK